MKKWILISLVLLALALGAIYLFIPSKLEISQNLRIEANKEGLYRKLSQPASWAEWWPGSKTMEATGAWELDGGLFQPLEQKMLSLSILLKEGSVETTAELTLIAIKTDSSLLHIETSFPASNNPFSRVAAYLKAVKIKKHFASMLQAINKNYSSVAKLYGYDIRKEKVVDSNLVFIATQLKSLPSTEQVYTMVKKLKDYILSQKAGATGNPMLNVFTRDSLLFDVRVAIPVDRRLPDAGEIHYKWMLGGGNILITEVKGGPEEIKKAYNQVNHYITDYKRLAPAIPFESMVTDRTVEKDSNQWITRIYYPVI